MAEYKHMHGYLEFESHKDLMNLVISLKASEHILEDDDGYFFLDERGHVIDTGEPTGVINLETFTVNFPEWNYRNLSTRLLGLLSEYKPNGELIIHSDNTCQVMAYLDGEVLMASDTDEINAYYDRGDLSLDSMTTHIEKSTLCLNGDYIEFEAQGFGDEGEFNSLRYDLLSNAGKALMGRLRASIAQVA